MKKKATLGFQSECWLQEKGTIFEMEVERKKKAVKESSKRSIKKSQEPETKR